MSIRRRSKGGGGGEEKEWRNLFVFDAQNASKDVQVISVARFWSVEHVYPASYI